MNLLTPYVDKMVSTFLDKSPQSPEVAHTAPRQQLAWDLTETMLLKVHGFPVSAQVDEMSGTGCSTSKKRESLLRSSSKLCQQRSGCSLAFTRSWRWGLCKWAWEDELRL